MLSMYFNYFPYHFTLFRFCLPFKNGMAIYLNKLECPVGCIVPSLVEIRPVVLEMIFTCCQCIFIIASSWKRMWPFIRSNLISFILESFLPSLVEISGLGEDFLNVVNVFSSLKNGMALNKPEYLFSEGYSIKTYEVPSEGTWNLGNHP